MTEKNSSQQKSNKRIVEIIFTSFTAIFIIASLTAEKFALHPFIILAFNISSYICGGWFGIQKVYKSIRKKKFNVDALMMFSAIGAAIIDQWHEGATLLFLFSLSNTLQSFAMARSRNAIKSLLKLRPNEATVFRDGKEIKVLIEDLKIGERVIIRPGENIPIDGKVIDGSSTVNQASITGESLPVEKNKNDIVYAGTLNGSGTLEILVEKPANDTTLSKIIQLVENAQSQKAKTQRFLEKFESYYAILVLTSSLLLIILPWLVFQQDFSLAFYRAMVVLVVASPCALVISTPVAILSAIASAARRGILFKGGAHVENLAEVKTIAFDKTGTLTQGRLSVSDIYLSHKTSPQNFTENDLLALAAALESRSEHPIAKAIANEAEKRSLNLPPMTNFVALSGRGVHASANGFLVWIGSDRMFEEHGEKIPEDLEKEKKIREAEGKTVLLLHRELRRTENVGVHEDEGGWLGFIAVSDIIRNDAAETLNALKKIGIERTVMLTGDNPAVAKTIASQIHVDEFHANLLPEQKVELLKTLQKNYGATAMVGDGVNDAPALATATVGIAMGAAGTDVALETADVVLMGDSLSNITHAIQLSRKAQKIVWQNITFSLLVIVVLVISTFTAELPLPLGVIGHEGSTLLVVLNGLRLLRK